mgnify:CR=1
DLHINYDGGILHVDCKFGWISSPFPDLRPTKIIFVWVFSLN